MTFFSKAALAVSTMLFLPGCNSNDGILKVYQDLALFTEKGAAINFKAGRTYRVSLTPYSLIGSDFYLSAYNSDTKAHSALARFDFVGFPMIPINGDFKVAAKEIRFQKVALIGSSSFGEVFGRLEYDRTEACDENTQKKLRVKELQGYRSVDVKVLNPEETQVLAEFHYKNRHNLEEILSESACLPKK